MADAPFMLSVSGARGIVGQTMTPAVAADFAAAYGSFVRGVSGESSPTVVIGRDSRPSGAMLSAAATSGLASVGCRVIDVGIVPTPTVGVMIRKHGAAAGMVITASHNPTPWNGIKCLDANGVAPSADRAGEIIERFRSRTIDFTDATGVGNVRDDRTAIETHVGRVLSRVDIAAIRTAGLRVALDSVNGGGCVAGRTLLDELGCEVVQINGEPNGLFAHDPEPIEANLGDLAATTRSAGAACGFAQDPDADRLAIIDEQGRYIGEEMTLVLAAQRLLDVRAAAGGTEPVRMAANLSTSRMIDDVAAAYPNVEVVRTAVGEANVVAAMLEDGAILGGEGNGGLIWPDVCFVRDSLSAMAIVLEHIATSGKPLSAIVDALPRYSMVKRKVDATALDDIGAALARVADVYSGERVDRTDGVRIDFADGWAHLRASNTEPIVRVIAEAPTRERAEALADEVWNAGVGQATG